MADTPHKIFMKILTTSLLTISSALCLSGLLSAQDLEVWEFNDPADTELSALTKGAGTATFPNAPQASTDGNGNLIVTQGADANDNLFRSATLSSGGSSTGIFELSFFYTAVDLQEAALTGANLGFGARDSVSGDLFQVRVQKQNGTLRLQHRVGSNNVNLEDFATDTLSDLTVRVVFDMDADTFDVYWTLGAGLEKRATRIAMVNEDLNFDEIRLVSNTNTAAFGANDSILVDYLRLTSTTKPSLVAIEDWQFNDPAGESFNEVDNDAGTVNLGGAAPQVLTDGNGNLNVSRGNAVDDNVFRTSTVTDPDQTEGRYEMKWLVSSATLAGVVDGGGQPVNGANFGFGIRDEGLNEDLFNVRIQALAGKVRLQTRVGNTTTTLENFGVASISDLRIRTVFDLDTQSFDVYWQLGAGQEFSSLGNAFPSPDMQFDSVRTVANTNINQWAATDEVKIDYLTIYDLDVVATPDQDIQLLIVAGPGANQVTVSWPSSVVGTTVLQSSPNLEEPWDAVDQTPVMVGEEFQVVIDAAEDLEFFRLSVDSSAP